jgi:hypothetical protein
LLTAASIRDSPLLARTSRRVPSWATKVILGILMFLRVALPIQQGLFQPRRPHRASDAGHRRTVEGILVGKAEADGSDRTARLERQLCDGAALKHAMVRQAAPDDQPAVGRLADKTSSFVAGKRGLECITGSMNMRSC